MAKILRNLLCAIALVALLPASTAQARDHDSNHHGFQLFEAMLFAGRPDLTKYGFKHLRIVDDHELYGPGESNLEVPSMKQIKKIVAGGAGPAGILVIDIEQWSMDGRAAAESRRKYIETLERFHRAAPGMKLALYSVLPYRDYWRAIGVRGRTGTQDWMTGNDAAAPIANQVDALFPSLYTFYEDQAGWTKFAIANLREARRLAHGKPVYCFLWPQYHDSGDHPFALLSGGYWKLQLETCHKYADGVVIWGGYTTKNIFTPMKWDDTAPWWKATLQFVKGLRH